MQYSHFACAARNSATDGPRPSNRGGLIVPCGSERVVGVVRLGRGRMLGAWGASKRVLTSGVQRPRQRPLSESEVVSHLVTLHLYCLQSGRGMQARYSLRLAGSWLSTA